MSRTPDQAVALARSYADAGWVYGRGRCLAFVETCYDAHGYYDATAAWQATRLRGTGQAPYGAPVWWTGGTKGHGHVALALGDGTCYSTDFGDDRYYGDGRVRRCHISSIAAHDSYLHYQGWSRDLAGVEVVPEEEEVTEQQIIDAVVKALNGQQAATAGHLHDMLANFANQVNARLAKIEEKLGA